MNQTGVSLAALTDLSGPPETYVGIPTIGITRKQFQHYYNSRTEGMERVDY